MKHLTILIVAALSACSTPHLTRRYASLDAGDSAGCGGTPTITLSTFVMDPERAVSPAAAWLTDRGQEALITGLSAKAGSANDLLRAVGSPVVPAEDRALTVERSRFKRRIIASVASANFGPADRLQRLALRLELVETADVKFVSWDKLVTKYESIDLGKLKFTQGSTIDAKTDLVTGAKEIPGIGLAYKNTQTLDEEIQLRRRWNAVTGELSDSKATLVLEGEIGIDLTGNIAIDVELESLTATEEPFFRFGNLRQPGGALTPAADVSVSPRFVRIAAQRKDVNVRTSADYVIRHVTGGAATLMEGDDHVKLVSGSVALPAASKLVPKGMMAFDVYSLQVQGGANDGRLLNLFTPGQVIMFESFEAALDFHTWLRDSWAVAAVTTVGRAPLHLGRGVALAQADVAALGIIRTHVNP
jgi:hypothetical protein